MRSSTKIAISAGLLALVAQTSAQVASVCPETNVCFKLNIPANTASSGSGDIFFQISGPSTYEWVGLGQGTGMKGSNMFLVYTSSGGSNVTLSPRSASGEVMPRFNSNAQVTLLEGSGVSNGIMTANIKCSNCNSWSGGTMDFKGSNGNWIYAFNPSNGPKNSNDQSASISQHTGHDTFRWDFTNAKGGSSVNPLVAAVPSGSATGSGGTPVTSCIQRNAASATAGSSSTSAAPAARSSSVDDDDNRDYRTRIPSGFSNFPTARPTSRPYDTRDEFEYFEKRQQQLPFCDQLPNNGGNNGGSNSGYTSTGSGGSSNTRTMLIAHGVLASLAFVILFPAGAIAVRLASFPGIVWVHAAFQVFAFVVYIAAFGLGVYIATQNKLLDHAHPIIGIVVLALVFFQPIGGLLHHSMFKKHGHRTIWSHAHVWGGRVAITLGIINGGLGLQLADSMGMSSKGGIIAYSVIAAVMWLAWVAASVIGERKRNTSSPPKYSARSASNESQAAETSVPTNGHYAPPKN